MSTLLPFTPVPVRARRDGWTAATQVDFIDAFAAAWDAALACALRTAA